MARFTLQNIATALIVSVKAYLSPVAFGVSAIAQNGEGKVLLVRPRYMPGWHLPGGGVGRAEPPERAILRELREEVGLLHCDPPEFLGLYTRKAGLATNLIALYGIKNIRIEFKPNLEIGEIVFADPASPPEGTSAGTRRRLIELANRTTPSPYW